MEKIFENYEEFEEYFMRNEDMKNNYSYLIIQYLILFRQWRRLKVKLDKLNLNFDDLENNDNISKEPYIDGEEIKWKDSEFTIADILKWNSTYYNKYFNRNVTSENEKNYYTEIIKEDKNIFDLFFLGYTPLLNIEYYSVQERASKKLEDKNFHFTFDEVGTGKTVVALYCMRNVIAKKSIEKNLNEVNILIVCPHNKMNEWQLDIRRQMGLYSFVVENGFESDSFKNILKEGYFYNNEPKIFIEANVGMKEKETLNAYSQQTGWDLIIIDEAHQCFSSYGDIELNKQILSSKKVLFLTATPIVLNSKKLRIFEQYIKMAKLITKVNDEAIIENLFSKNDYYTQLFREDLGITPKTREIKFIKCERWEDREKYLQVLADVKGEMTRLLYEQDDDTLVYGIYENFKQDIEKAGYGISAKPDIENKKYKVLLEELSKIENKEKSYIVFCNLTCTVRNIFKKLCNDKKTGWTVAYKCGNENDWDPKGKAVNKNNLLEYLKHKIEEGKKVIFITTGATGGTGLNLGTFDGIVNYELPFTSIELEQRFGRVDRMDKATDNSKQMIFIINKDSNPMLRYSVMKLSVTCAYMPIRNTVLFNDEFINSNIGSFRYEFENDKFNENDINLINTISNFNLQDDEKEIINKYFETIIKEKVFEENIDDYREEVTKYLNTCNADKENIKNLIIKIKKLIELENDLNYWINITCNQEVNEENINSYLIEEDKNDDSSEYVSMNNGGDDDDCVVNDIIKVENKTKKKQSILDEVLNIQKKCENIEENIKKLSNQQNNTICSGIFYLKKDDSDNYKYIKDTVDNFRESNGLKYIW